LKTIDMTALPSYAEASEIRAESPPNYKELYRSTLISQSGNPE